MNRSDRVTSKIITGATAGAIGTAAGLLINFGVDADAVLALLGTFIGAGLAVGGSIWVGERAKKVVEAHELRLITENLTLLKQSAERAQTAKGKMDNPFWTPEFREAKDEFEMRINACLLLCQQAIAASKELDFVHRAALATLVPWLHSAQKFCDDVSREFEPEPWDDRTWSGTFYEVIEIVSDTLPTLKPN